MVPWTSKDVVSDEENDFEIRDVDILSSLKRKSLIADIGSVCYSKGRRTVEIIKNQEHQTWQNKSTWERFLNSPEL